MSTEECKKRPASSEDEKPPKTKLTKLASLAAAAEEAAAEAAADAAAQAAVLHAQLQAHRQAVAALNGIEDPSVLSEEVRLFKDKIENASKKVVVGFVGLPARGKSFLARKLAYYLNWMGVMTRIFNHGDYRRNILGARQSADFFHPDNAEGTQLRLSLARLALRDLFQFLHSGGGQVGILDATNSSIRRRKMVEKECEAVGVQVFWVESICDRDTVIEDNIYKVKVHLAEYADMKREEIVDDFKRRIAFYEQAYASLESTGQEANSSFMKIYNLGDDFLIHKPKGALVMRIVRFLMCVHNRPRSIYLSRHGESIFNKTGRIGGDSGLTPAGVKYSWELRAFMKNQKTNKLKLWTSSLQRTIQTAALFDEDLQQYKSLDELNAGECEGSTYDEIKKNHPKLYEARQQNKYYYRYPRGESYKDLVLRLEPLLLELEREEDLLIISHQAVCRCLLAYFKNIPQQDLSKELPYLEVPLHTVLKVVPKIFDCEIERFTLGPAAVNTQQSRPESREATAADSGNGVSELPPVSEDGELQE